MKLVKNENRKSGKPEIPDEIPFPGVEADAPLTLLKRCPVYAQTPLVEAHGLGRDGGFGKLFLKDETARMGLGSFKALGAAYVIAHAAFQSGAEDFETALEGRIYVTASAGNHGLSVAAGARIFGAKSVIFLAQTVPAAFAGRLRSYGARVVVEGSDYEASMQAASDYAEKIDGILLSDSSWEGYFELPHRLMEGYLASASEIVDQMPVMPTHIFLQAGVGGLAGAMAAYFRHVWGDAPVIVVVEPSAAPALQASMVAGKPVFADGPVSNMGRLDCKEPSLIALKGLARDADYFLTVSDALAAETAARLKAFGLASTPSGAGGLAGVFAGVSTMLEVDDASTALCLISEGVE